jgi:hypothetical protein
MIAVWIIAAQLVTFALLRPVLVMGKRGDDNI